MIGIIVAIQEELAAIEAHVEDKQKLDIAGITFVKGTISAQPVVIIQSGVGKGFAAMATTILLEHYEIDGIVNIGTAGGLRQEQQILDAVVSKQVVQHDFDTSAVDGDDGVGVFFDADPHYVELCVRVLADMHVRTYTGLIASGDEFVAHEEAVTRITTTFPEAICAEMEAGAIAQVCSHYQKPFVVLRSLSDVAYHNDSQMDFLEYVTHASKRSASFVKSFIKELHA